MRTLKIFKSDFFSDFTKMVDRKKKGPEKDCLNLLKPKIKKRYAEYESKCSRPEDVDPNKKPIERTKKEVDALESAYVNGSKLQNEWQAKLSDGKTIRCPYCQIEKAGEWDHFLPTSKFPDYWVYQPNLVRSCGFCNSQKNDDRVVPKREIIHPYFDPLDAVRFLKCDVTIRQNIAIVFSISPDATHQSYSKYLEDIVRSHFLFFGLADKFAAESSREVNDLGFHLRQNAEGHSLPPSQKDIERYCSGKVKDACNEGKNHNCWEVALWLSLKDASKGLSDYWLKEFQNQRLLRP
jgi:hypothetical protein